jgi:Domain of unknown function (DUF4214)
MKLFSATLIIALAAIVTFGQQAPTLRIVTEDPNLPSELFYGDIKVKPLRLRPGTNTVITINDPDFYVSTHYVDFLSRFPDQAGFNFWQGQITSCGANDVACNEVKRINVSASFFMSIEFQESGFLVYKMNKAAFGNITGQPVPVRRETFMPDTRAIAKDVIVGAQGWEAKLAANKDAFALAFVQRPAFQAAYPLGMTAVDFVNRLDTNAGNVLSSSERATLAGVLTDPNDVTKRAQVVRSVAENPALTNQEFRKAFVLMQYYGYLRRNPDDAPEATRDFAGFNFWLSKLNAFNGDFIQAEMVKAFLSSGEYLARF